MLRPARADHRQEYTPAWGCSCALSCLHVAKCMPYVALHPENIHLTAIAPPSKPLAPQSTRLPAGTSLHDRGAHVMSETSSTSRQRPCPYQPLSSPFAHLRYPSRK